MKLQKRYSMVFFFLFFVGSISTNFAFASTSEGCGLFDLTFECDLSGWMKLVMGDLAIGAVLALLLHYLAHRSNLKVEENTKILKDNSKAIQKIIESQEESRNRRKIYVAQTLKNHFSSILLNIGLMNKLVTTSENKVIDKDQQTDLNQKQIDLKNLIHRTRMTLDLSIDIFDPMFIDQIERFLTNLDKSDFIEFGKNDSLSYEEIKTKITLISKRLNESLDSDVVLK